MYIPENMLGHIQKVFAGEYEVPFASENPVIFDVGANIGAFARWANARWVNSEIVCFEPVKSNFEILKKNTIDMKNVQLFNVAVSANSGKQKIFYGKNNIGEASLYRGSQQTYDGEEVDVITASELPPCHIMKIDTEGSEIEILESYRYNPAVYLIEYHSERNRYKIDEMLRDNYILLGSNTNKPNYGVVKYGLKKLIS